LSLWVMWIAQFLSSIDDVDDLVLHLTFREEKLDISARCWCSKYLAGPHSGGGCLSMTRSTDSTIMIKKGVEFLYLVLLKSAEKGSVHAGG
jgi:hypothetical protein